MPRPNLPAHDTDAHREWVAAAVAAPFNRPAAVPRLVYPKPEPAPPAAPVPDLVDMMQAPRQPAPTPEPEPAGRAAESPWYVKQGLPIDAVLRAHFGGLISPPSELAQKRARLKRERAQARTVGGAQGARNTHR